MASIAVDHLRKVYSNGTVAIEDLSFEVGDGAFLALLRPSGCGKTTALRGVADLEDLSGGAICIDDRAGSSPG